ncbi:MAG: DUF2334 domain-containing protein [Acidobacteriota bacterium]
MKYKVLLIPNYESYDETLTSDYVENMLISWGINYDLQEPLEQLTLDKIITNNTLNYIVIIVTKEFSKFSSSEIGVLENVSKNFGVSLISFYSCSDQRSNNFFGIKEKSGTKYVYNFKIQNNLDFVTDGLNDRNLKGARVFDIVLNSNALKIVDGEGTPVFFVNQYGKGINYYFNFEPSGWLEIDGRQLLLKRSIIQNSKNGFFYFDLEGTIILRMDDPLSNNVTTWSDTQSYQPFNYKRMDQKDWEETVNVLKEFNAGMSISAVPGYVDDGNPARGRLYKNGVEVINRQCGTEYDSKDMKYIFISGLRAGKVLDHEEEFKGIKNSLESYEKIDIQQHGYTHTEMNRSALCAASDKYTNSKWFAEFYHLYNGTNVSYSEQWDAIQKGYNKLIQWFDYEPSIFIPPQNAISSNTTELLENFNFKVMSTFDFTFLRKKKSFTNPFIQTHSVKSMYWLANPRLKWIAKTFPMVIYFHDLDITYFGIEWLQEFLTGWKEMGIEIFLSFGEFLGYVLSKVEGEYSYNRGIYTLKITVDISNTGGPQNLKSSRYFNKRKIKIRFKIPESWKRFPFYRFGQISETSLKSPFLNKDIIEFEFNPFEDEVVQSKSLIMEVPVLKKLNN